MSTNRIQPNAAESAQSGDFRFLPDQLPLTVRQAAVYLAGCGKRDDAT